MSHVDVHPQLDTISLCTGGGGLDLALELAIAGARSVCMVEREAFAVAHLVAAMRAGRLATCPVWSDARTFDGRPWRGLVDGVIGGIPCQPHSLAGRKQGSLDARDLWSTARRIVVQSRARFVLIENVGGMLAAGADEIAGAERVWRDLRKLGFAVEGGLFTAAEVGASHQRERLFILGIHDGLADAGNGGWRGEGDAANPSGGLDRGSGELDDAARIGRREGRAEPELRSGRNAAGGTAQPVGNAIGSGHDRWADEPFGRPLIGTTAEGASRSADDAMADAECVAGERSGKPGKLEPAGGGAQGQGHQRQRGGQASDDHLAGSHLFPPGPGDIAGWRGIFARAPQLEPAVRRVADGLAAGLDATGAARVDRLRMLGNGVVPLEGAYAIRTLLSRLAARGSAGAARLMDGMT